MKVLVLYSGAKDSAIAWWLSKSKLIEDIYVAPGCPGTEAFAVNLPDLDTQDSEQVLKACRAYSIDFVVIGTEGPLLAGVVDSISSNGIPCFGAPLKSLSLETDRSFARALQKDTASDSPATGFLKTFRICQPSLTAKETAGSSPSNPTDLQFPETSSIHQTRTKFFHMPNSFSRKVLYLLKTTLKVCQLQSPFLWT